MYRRRKYYNSLITTAMFAFCIFILSIQAAENTLFTYESRFCIFIAALTSAAFPLLISGIGGRFLDRDMDLSMEIICRKYLPQAGISMLFWWIVTALLYMRLEYPTELDTDTFLECLSIVLENPYRARFYQLTFVMVLFYPFLKKAANSKKATRYTILISFMLCMVNPLLEMIPYLRYLYLFTRQLNWQFFTVYTFYLFLGIYLRDKEIPWHWRMVIYCAGALSAIAIYMFTVVSSANAKEFIDKWMTDESVFVAILTASLIIFIKSVMKRLCKGNSSSYILCEMGSYGYVFPVCCQVSIVIISFTLSLEEFEVLPALILKVCGCMILCFAMGYGMKRLPGLSYLSSAPGENTL